MNTFFEFKAILVSEVLPSSKATQLWILLKTQLNILVLVDIYFFFIDVQNEDQCGFNF